MERMQKINRKAAPRTLAALTIAALLSAPLLGAASAQAGGYRQHDEAEGIVLGFNAGFGGSLLDYRQGSKSITEDARGGGMGALRVGYAFNDKLALSIEGYGFGTGDSEEEDEWGVGAGFVAMTWHPRGGGLFLRGGFGAGGGDFINPDDDTKVTIKDRAAFLFGIGYDWQLTDSFTLGVSLDGFALDAGGATGYDDDTVGAGGVTVQCNWRL